MLAPASGELLERGMGDSQRHIRRLREAGDRVSAGAFFRTIFINHFKAKWCADSVRTAILIDVFTHEVHHHV